MADKAGTETQSDNLSNGQIITNWLSFALYAGSILLSVLWKPKEPKEPTPSDDVGRYMRAVEGNGIPVIFGYAYVQDAIGVYYNIPDDISCSQGI